MSVKPTVAENRWLGQLHRLMAKKPPAVWFFCNGRAYAMRKMDGKKMRIPTGGVDSKYMIDTDSLCDFDGGDW